MLPGTHHASDRYVRASWNLNAAPRVNDPRFAVATVFSLVRNISVPLGISDPEKPNIASTLWRVPVADSRQKRHYFESTFSPAVFWVDLDDLDLAPGSKSTKLSLKGHPVLSGDVSSQFTPVKPFKFLSY